MSCIKSCAGALFALALLAGCATSPEAPERADPEPDLNQPLDPAADAPRVPVPNPYAAQPEPNDPATRALLDKANAAMAAKAWGKAEPLLLQAIEQSGGYSGVYYNLGRVYYELNRKEEALAQFQNAVAMNDKNIYAYNALALIKREQGDFAAAETAYRQALAVWPDHANSHKNLGILYDLYMGRLADALSHYRNYQALQPEPDRLVNAWIVDLERRMPAPADATPAEPAATEEGE
ncbi:tetratricopeptide repeat protein [Simiduia sp. 21SJ11W-1]|uniref:tetratricopeptide repeat protein n=1 Tax=Simiduia sp. 21SJ11W-1 TaxID=2909669 RepID=UPI00209DFCB6|nr:tetratricopeptide repeat protein [Simiduia sp. 21SJ11W-1]UTA47872.1 tetratricopeptide repeat protein [Simiduia sp. 21SJ11W-1]